MTKLAYTSRDNRKFTYIDGKIYKDGYNCCSYLSKWHINTLNFKINIDSEKSFSTFMERYLYNLNIILKYIKDDLININNNSTEEDNKYYYGNFDIDPNIFTAHGFLVDKETKTISWPGLTCETFYDNYLQIKENDKIYLGISKIEKDAGFNFKEIYPKIKSKKVKHFVFYDIISFNKEHRITEECFVQYRFVGPNNICLTLFQLFGLNESIQNEFSIKDYVIKSFNLISEQTWDIVASKQNFASYAENKKVLEQKLSSNVR